MKIQIFLNQQQWAEFIAIKFMGGILAIGKFELSAEGSELFDCYRCGDWADVGNNPNPASFCKKCW